MTTFRQIVGLINQLEYRPEDLSYEQREMLSRLLNARARVQSAKSEISRIQATKLTFPGANINAKLARCEEVLQAAKKLEDDAFKEIMREAFDIDQLVLAIPDVLERLLQEIKVPPAMLLMTLGFDSSDLMKLATKLHELIDADITQLLDVLTSSSSRGAGYV